MKTILKGFSFGLVLQIAVGPLFIYIITVALNHGFFTAFAGVVAVTLADALFVVLAILGIGRLLKAEKTKRIMKIASSFMIILFGIAIFLTSFGINLIPSFSSDIASSNSVFLTALILTLSSPLTLVFWAGVFGARLAKDDAGIKNTALFGAGAVLSTLIFLTTASAIAGIFTSLMTPCAIRILNWIAGLVLIGFGILMLTKKNN